MCLYTQAIEEIEYSSSCKVIAPSGGWEQSQAKEEWLKKLALSKSIDRWFIVGDGYNRDTKEIVRTRAQFLANHGVKVHIMSCFKEHGLGIIIFDEVAFFGAQVNGKLRLLETRLPSHLGVLEDLFKDALEVSDGYTIA